MAGISSLGIHIPRLRMPLSLAHAPSGAPSTAEKAVAGHDEDVVTMAVAAAMDCLRGRESERVDRLYLASTSAPFAEKSSAAVVARALNLGDEVHTADFGGSLRATATALTSALEAVLAGSAARVLVLASDVRVAEPRSAQEQQLGDAAIALLVERDAPLRFEAGAAVSRQLFDVWREDGARTLRSWEERFVVQHGYGDSVIAALHRLRGEHGIAAEDVQYLACYAPDVRSCRALARQSGFAAEQVVAPLFGRVGNCGNALVPLLLCQALPQMRAGERLLTVFQGDGAHAISWTLEGESPLQGHRLEQQLAARLVMSDYHHYLQCRGLQPDRATANPADGISGTVSWREQDADISFLAACCNNCGTEQFPPARLCYRCFSRDDFTLKPLAVRGGQVASYTEDHFFPSPTPPVVAGMCEVDGGARVYLQMADYAGEPLRTGLPVEFVFRRMHETGGKPAYFWKSRLLASAASGMEVSQQ